MKQRRTNEERSQSTRAQLLAAGRRLFAEQGYESTTMTQVAATAELSTGALYHHWPTKRELLAAVVGSLHHDLAVEIAEHIPRHRDALARFQHAASVFLRRCADHDVAQILLIDGPAVLGATWNELDQRWWQGPTEDLLREAIDDGSLVVADPTLLATALLGSLTALGRTIAARPNTTTQRQQAAAVLSTLVDGLRVHG